MMNETTTPARFEVGKEYFGIFITNADSRHTVKILKRTEKNVWIQCPHEKETVRRKVYTAYKNGNEYIFPFGQYSMALTVDADRLA